MNSDDWRYYSTRDLQVVPYMPGTPVYLDGMLPYLYTRTKEEGKIERVFCGDILNMDGFVNYFYTRKTMQVLCMVEPGKEKNLKPVGYCWVDNPKGVDGARAAMCGFAFFNEGRRVAVALGRLGIAYWVTALKIDVLHGVLLESNFAAAHYAALLGFEDVGVDPEFHYAGGELVGARVMVLRGRHFIPQFQGWFAKQNKSL